MPPPAVSQLSAAGASSCAGVNAGDPVGAAAEADDPRVVATTSAATAASTATSTTPSARVRLLRPAERSLVIHPSLNRCSPAGRTRNVRYHLARNVRYHLVRATFPVDRYTGG